MSKLNILEPLVKEILKEDMEARKNDHYLLYEVYAKLLDKHDLNVPYNQSDIFYDMFIGYFLNYKEHKLPTFESVSRCRRKLQAEYEELRPSEEVQEARLNETSEYIDYAIGGYQSSFMDFIDRME